MSVPFRERNPVIIGAISLSVIALLILAAFRASDLPLIGGGDTYYAEFSESGGLQVNDEVRIAGVRVGKVDSIELDGDKVKVGFKVKTDSAFGEETQAAIRVKTLLGAMYLSLVPAGDGQLEEDTTIPVERTSSPFDVVDAFSGLAETSSDIDTDQLAESLSTLADLTRNTPEEFRGALEGVSALSETIASRDQEINSLLNNLERVSTVLDDRDQDIIALMRDSDVLFRALVSRRDAIHDLLVSTSTLSEELTALVTQSRADLKPALDHLENVVAVLNKNEDNIDNSLRLMAPFYRVFANTLGTGPWFDTYIMNLPPVAGPGGGLGGIQIPGGWQLMDLRRVAIPVVITVLLITAALVMFTGGTDQKTVTAYFPRTISIYEGSDVRVLGVPVGQIDKVQPEGTRVKVTMSYDAEVKIPSQAEAVIISPSIVGDRYVQLTPAYTTGDVMADDTVLEEGRTSVPLELDQIYSSIDQLTVALGPTGANKNGALSDLLESTAKNFGGEGARFKQTIQDFGTLSETLDNNKEELFGSAAELEAFISTLAENDGTVRAFNQSLGDVSTMLEGEREELAASLGNLGVALEQVGGFVEENKASLGRNIKGLNRVAKVLVKQRGALDEILTAGPLALNNLALTYNPDAGTLDTNANLGNLAHELTTNPGLVLCALSDTVDKNGDLCDTFKLLNGKKKRAAPFGAAGDGSGASSPFDPTLNGLIAP